MDLNGVTAGLGAQDHAADDLIEVVLQQALHHRQHRDGPDAAAVLGAEAPRHPPAALLVGRVLRDGADAGAEQAQVEALLEVVHLCGMAGEEGCAGRQESPPPLTNTPKNKAPLGRPSKKRKISHCPPPSNSGPPP